MSVCAEHGESDGRSGPLRGVRVLELAGLGPGPFAAMMLADAGAEVITIDRPVAKRAPLLRQGGGDALSRGRIRIGLDLRQPDGLDVLLRLAADCDALIEGFRPGVMERLGAGPDVCLARRPALVYGRMTGWGQSGPLAHAAGHDLNYIALSGALHAIGTEDTPVPPLNLVGDFGGGGMMLAFGVLAALLEARQSGRGQVVDAAMCDGAALLMAPFYAMLASGRWQDRRASNALDGGVPWYGVYRCSDGGFVSLAPLEDAFFAELVRLLELPEEAWAERAERARWPRLRERLASRFVQRSRGAWTALLEGTDACFAPVLSIAEASFHTHLRERRNFIELQGNVQPAPAPRFSRTPSEARPAAADEAARRVLARARVDSIELQSLLERHIVEL